jgi:hypothetical protein
VLLSIVRELAKYSLDERKISKAFVSLFRCEAANGGDALARDGRTECDVRDRGSGEGSRGVRLAGRNRADAIRIEEGRGWHGVGAFAVGRVGWS